MPKRGPYETWVLIRFVGSVSFILGVSGCTLTVNKYEIFGVVLGVSGAIGGIMWLLGKCGAWIYSDKKTIGGRRATQTFHSKIVGVTHHNSNGTSRQKHLKRLSEGQTLRVVRDRDNEYDPNAIAVYDGRRQLGYLSRDLAEQFASVLDNGGAIECAVSGLTGGDDRNFGCNIRLTIYP